MKTVAVLGSTGSIGRSALRVLSQYPEGFEVKYLSGYANADTLDAQCRAFSPVRVALLEDHAAARLQREVSVPVDRDMDAICNYARDADIVIIAIAGAAGAMPMLAAADAGRTILVANKEGLLLLDDILLQSLQRSGGTLLPIDSEHCSIFQMIRGHQSDAINRLILTASGGSLWEFDAAARARATMSDVCRHPTWQMGKKITVDSATLMNKALEIGEASILFNMPISAIDVVIHRQSIVHSFVELLDGTLLAHLSTPDMCLAISSMLHWPAIAPSEVPRVSWQQLSAMTFQPLPEPIEEEFPCFHLAQQCMRRHCLSVLSEINEEAVRRFLEQEIEFADIYPLLSDVIARLNPTREEDLSQRLATNAEARALASRWAPVKTVAMQP